MSSDHMPQISVEPDYSPTGRLIGASMVANDGVSKSVIPLHEKVEVLKEQLRRKINEVDFPLVIALGNMPIAAQLAQVMSRQEEDEFKKRILVTDFSEAEIAIMDGQLFPPRIPEMKLAELEALHANPADTYLPRFNPLKKIPSPSAEKRRKKKNRDQRRARKRNKK